MRYIIFANGQPPTAEQANRLIKAGDCIIGVDGGANFATQIGMSPHIVIGDLDSIDPEVRTSLTIQHTQFSTFPRDKDQTDLELALEYLHARGGTELLVFSALGGRLDHLLTNVLLLAHPRFKQVSISVFDPHSPDHLGKIMHGPSELSWSGLIDQALSLIPISDTVSGVTLSGTRWPLDAATLFKGTTLGISNRMSARAGHLAVLSGTLLAILPMQIELK